MQTEFREGMKKLLVVHCCNKALFSNISLYCIVYIIHLYSVLGFGFFGGGVYIKITLKGDAMPKDLGNPSLEDQQRIQK